MNYIPQRNLGATLSENYDFKRQYVMRRFFSETFTTCILASKSSRILAKHQLSKYFIWLIVTAWRSSLGSHICPDPPLI